MKAIIVYLLKSLALAKRKLILCVLAAVLSAWGISTMIYSYVMTERDFVRNFAESVPADLVLTIENPTDSLLETLRANDHVRILERREAIPARVRNRNGSWTPVTVFGCSNVLQPEIGKFRLITRLPSNHDAVFIERNGMSFLREAIDSLALQFPGSTEVKVAFAGTVHDAGQAPSQMEQALYAYTSIETLRPYLSKTRQRYLVKTTLTDPGMDELTSIGNTLVSLASKANITMNFMVPPPGEHPHQGIVDRISFMQRSFGGILSVLGSILLSLILITWVYPQIPGIGVMKSVGAPSTVILGSYSFVLFLIVAAGMIVGIPAGYFSARSYSRLVDFIQNFEPVTSPLPLWIHAVVILPVIGIPMTFAIIPLRQASYTTVQNALNQIFYTPYKSAFTWTQKLITDTGLKYSINNLFRSNQRTLLLIVLLVAGVGLFMTGSNLRYSLRRDLAMYTDKSDYNIIAVLKDSTTTRFKFIESLPFVDKVAYANTRAASFQLPIHTRPELSSLRTLGPEYEFDESSVAVGKFKRDCERCVYVNQRYQQDFSDVPIGSSVELTFMNLRTERFIYSGVIKDLTSAGFIRFSPEEVKPFQDISIRVKEGTESAEILSKIDDAFLDNNVDVRQLVDLGVRLAGAENHLAPTFLIIQVMGVITIFIALSGLLIVLNLSIQERAREMGIMKALGGTSYSIVYMYLREYTIISAIAIAIGIGAGAIFNKGICKLFGMIILSSEVTPLIDFAMAGVATATLLGIQTLLIFLYVRFKVIHSSASLLRQIF